jgi:hypothetical protein
MHELSHILYMKQKATLELRNVIHMVLDRKLEDKNLNSMVARISIM